MLVQYMYYTHAYEWICVFAHMDMKLGKLTVSKQGENLKIWGLCFTLTTKELLKPALYDTSQRNSLIKKACF